MKTKELIEKLTKEFEGKMVTAWKHGSWNVPPEEAFSWFKNALYRVANQREEEVIEWTKEFYE